MTLTVNQATPTVTWAAPAAITYGTALSATQLDATAGIPGTFAYTPAAGTVLTAGTQTLNVTFTPTDTTDYTTASKSVTLTVNQATPTVNWATPAAITYGTALSATQLDATAGIQGTFAYTPAAGTVLTAGTQTLNVTFTPTDTIDYTTASKSVTLTVNQATPTVNWAAPAAITYGTALSATQLDATAGIQGTFAYTPAAGTVLTAGTQTLNVTFTPTDTIDYTTASKSVTLTVNSSGVVPAAPTGLTVTEGTNQVALSWTASTGATSYNVYQGTSGGGETLLASGVKTTSYTSSGLAANGTVYYYEVSAVNAIGESSPSNQMAAIPSGGPAAPTGLTASAGDALVTLTWTAPSGATSYNIYRGTSSTGAHPVIAMRIAGTSFTDMTVTPGTTYYYWALAFGSLGNSGLSNSASATPQGAAACCADQPERHGRQRPGRSFLDGLPRGHRL